MNPGPQMEEKLIDFIDRQRREERYMQVVRKEKSSLDTTSVKMDVIHVTTKILTEEQEKIKGHVKSWETKLRKMEEEHNFVIEWQRRNNILIFRIEECHHESYFDILKITDDILRMKPSMDIFSSHIDSVHRLGKKRER